MLRCKRCNSLLKGTLIRNHLEELLSFLIEISIKRFCDFCNHSQNKFLSFFKVRSEFFHITKEAPVGGSNVHPPPACGHAEALIKQWDQQLGCVKGWPESYTTDSPLQ